MTTPPQDKALDPATLLHLHRILGSNPTRRDLPSLARSGYQAALATIDGLASGMPERNVSDGVPDLTQLVGSAEAAANPPADIADDDPEPSWAVLDRTELRKAVELVRLAQPDDASEDFRRGYHVALMGVEELADHMPDLYAGTCPNVPALVTQLWKCRSLAEVREVLKPIAIEQYVGFGIKDIEQEGER